MGFFTWPKGKAKKQDKGRERDYEGATKSRRTIGWQTSGKSANSEVYRAGHTLRDRSRDLVRNNPLASRAIDALVTAIVGIGIKPRNTDPRLALLWDEWIPNAVNGAPMGGYAMQALLVRGWLESGGSLMLRRPRHAGGGMRLPIQIQPLEIDHLDFAKTQGLPSGGRIVQGVEFAPTGEIVAYWIFETHPGEAMIAMDSVRYDATQVSHITRPTRPGQVNGTPILTPVMQALRDLHDTEDAERVRKNLEACAMAVVTGGDDDTAYNQSDSIGDTTSESGGTAYDSNGNIVEVMEPGLIIKAQPGKTIEFLQPHANPDFVTYMQHEQRQIATGLSMPYEVLTQDLSMVNFSSIRMGQLEFRAVVRTYREFIVKPLILRPLWSWFVDTAIAAGLVPAGDYAVDWAFPRFEEVDRVKAATADAIELRTMISSRPSVIAERGGNAEKITDEIAADMKELIEEGLIPDGATATEVY